jgi:enoyl-CoA hydratase
MEIALTGEHFPAARLHAAGLVNVLVPAGGALAGAVALAQRVAPGAPLALAATKRVIAQAGAWNSAEAFARQGEIINPVFTSADAMEGALAFAENAFRPGAESSGAAGLPADFAVRPASGMVGLGRAASRIS